MKCVIPGNNIKIFGKSIHSLSRIGDDLHIEPTDEGLCLRTVNSARSAYASFIFKPEFFLHYDSANTESQGSEEESTYKVGLKAVLTVFKSLSLLEKTVDKCQIRTRSSRIEIQLYCKHGIVKTHKLTYTDATPLQVLYNKEFSPNVITGHARLFSEAVTIFQSNQEEVTLSAEALKLTIKNYIEQEKDASKQIQTQMCLDPEEFETYQVGVDTKITFCLKEFRAILVFAESNNVPVTLNFERAGQPLIACLDSDPAYDASFVLATLAEDEQGEGESGEPASVRMATQAKRTNRRTAQPSQHADAANINISVNETVEAGRLNLSNWEQMPKQPPSRAPATMPSSSRPAISRAPDEPMSTTASCTPPPVTVQASCTTPSFATTSSIRPACPHPSTSMFEDAFCEKCNSESPVIPRIMPSFRSASHNGDDGEDDGTLVPGTPPSKKAKTLFIGWSQSSSQASSRDSRQVEPNQPEVLVEETDSEED